MPEPIRSREAALAADAADPLGYARARFALPEGRRLPRRQLPRRAADRRPGRGERHRATRVGPRPHRVLERQRVVDAAGPRRRPDRRAGRRRARAGDVRRLDQHPAVPGTRSPWPGSTRAGGRIVTDGANFPTDQYLAESAARLLGMQLVRVSPRDVGAVLGPDVARGRRSAPSTTAPASCGTPAAVTAGRARRRRPDAVGPRARRRRRAVRAGRAGRRRRGGLLVQVPQRRAGRARPGSTWPPATRTPPICR